MSLRYEHVDDICRRWQKNYRRMGIHERTRRIQ